MDCSIVGKPPWEQKSKKLAIALGVCLSFASLILLIFALVWYRKKRKKLTILNISDKQEEGLISLGNLRNFTFRELQLATDNFSSKNIVGTGGFGNVYKGKLGDGILVAVKRLKDLTGSFGESQFRTELEMISLAVHRNLLRLIGYCATSNERLLVYPYMSNGSVASRLRVMSSINRMPNPNISVFYEDWPVERYRSPLAAPIAILVLVFQSTASFPAKTNAFALEVKKIQQEKKVEVLLDRELGNNYDRIEVGEMLQVAMLCTQYLPAHHPKMSEVVRMLEGDGLTEKWAASHNHSNPTMNLFPKSFSNKRMPHPTTGSKHHEKSHDQSSNMLGTGMDEDDEHSLDSYAMELSGPRLDQKRKR
ncbi:hypothetical protein CRYUN_Cryun02cG0099800 [Craigia yunnanensis]